jgi:prophage antirepressor-like protein
MNPSAVVPFRFESHEVRALNINGDPWFVAKDVCSVLEIEWRGSSSVSFLDDDEKGVRDFRTPGGEQEMIVISESGLYTLIIRSNKPQAKPFRKWVTAEVLPSIRKTGGYVLPGAETRHRRSDIHHHRGPVSPGGLDIRYTLDLTKVIIKPTRQTLDLLGRLTGVDVSDLAAEISGPRPVDSREEIAAVIDRFSGERLQPSPGTATQFRILYADFLAWYAKQEHFPTGYIPSARAFSIWCDAHGYERRKPSGVATVYGVRLRGVEVAA